MEPLLYLDAHHDTVEGLGITPETAEYFKAGYAGRGTLRGRFCVPIHAVDGMLIAYVGIAVVYGLLLIVAALALATWLVYVPAARRAA